MNNAKRIATPGAFLILRAIAALSLLLVMATACTPNTHTGHYPQAGTHRTSHDGMQKGALVQPGADSAADEAQPHTQMSLRLKRKSASAIHEKIASAAAQNPGVSSPVKTAYLTFDDGPSGSTRRILNILRRYGVKATFFVVGTTSEEGKALYKRIADEGHAIGNHTFSHDYRSVYRSREAFRRDVDKLNRLLQETTGRATDIIRYPGGSNNKLASRFGGLGMMNLIVRDMRAVGYQYFDWNISSTDAAAAVQDRDVIIGSVLEAARGKRDAIVLMHDNTRKTTTVEALPTVIEGLNRQGFVFDVLRRSSYTFHFLEPD